MYYNSVGLGHMIRNERTSNFPEKNCPCAVLKQRLILALTYFCTRNLAMVAAVDME